MNTTTPRLAPEDAFYHGAHLVFLDALACGAAGDGTSVRTAARLFLLELMDRHGVVKTWFNLMTKVDVQKWNVPMKDCLAFHHSTSKEVVIIPV